MGTPFSYKVNKIQLYHSENLFFVYISEIIHTFFSSEKGPCPAKEHNPSVNIEVHLSEFIFSIQT